MVLVSNACQLLTGPKYTNLNKDITLSGVTLTTF